jgi:hypothetical protein
MMIVMLLRQILNVEIRYMLEILVVNEYCALDSRGKYLHIQERQLVLLLRVTSLVMMPCMPMIVVAIEHYAPTL